MDVRAFCACYRGCVCACVWFGVVGDECLAFPRDSHTFIIHMSPCFSVLLVYAEGGVQLGADMCQVFFVVWVSPGLCLAVWLERTLTLSTFTKL